MAETSWQHCFKAEDAMTVARQVLAGLSYLHQKGIAHRDIKPHNILLDWPIEVDPMQGRSLDGVTAKLSDFSLSRCGLAPNSDESSPSVILGTKCYMAPEIVRQTMNGEKILFLVTFTPPELSSTSFSLGLFPSTFFRWNRFSRYPFR